MGEFANQFKVTQVLHRNCADQELWDLSVHHILACFGLHSTIDIFLFLQLHMCTIFIYFWSSMETVSVIYMGKVEKLD
jgi:hypothetical protein